MTSKVISAMSMSLDGYVAGPGAGPGTGLGIGGEVLHQWIYEPTEPDAALLDEMVTGAGAVVMGRDSYDQCAGIEWADGGPLGKVPCYVLTHNPPADCPAPDVFTFVTDGIESALTQAAKVADGKVVALHGATVPQQALRAGMLDELVVHLVPVLLGDGVRLFDLLGGDPVTLERTRAIPTAHATHLWFRVVR